MRKAQSALEYLLTYSWAFIIIVIVGAALFALGVFNPASSTALQVRGLSNFQIDDGKIETNGNMTLVIGVKTGLTTNLTDIDFSIQGISCSDTADDADIIVTPSQTQTIVLDPASVCSLTAGDSVIIDVTIDYLVGRSIVPHTDSGTITMLVQ